jgi:thermitase
MRRSRAVFLSILLVFLICTAESLIYAATVLKHETPHFEPPPAFVPDRVIVAFKPGTPGLIKRAAHSQAGGRVINVLDSIGAELVGIPNGTVNEKIAAYRRNPNVRYAEPNYYRMLEQPPDEGLDPGVCNGGYFDEQWGLDNTGQGFQMDSNTYLPCGLTGTDDADIDWMEVWESGIRGRNTIKIAIVDSGVEYTHPDLASKCVEVWATAGIYQAGEGPEDLIGHGTHVAGTAAAATNNGQGVAGVGINTSFGSLKACRCYPSPSFCLTAICEDFDIAEAILYASDEGYHIINMSLGGAEDSAILQNAISVAVNKGLILVAAAGNEYSHNPAHYPSGYPGVISVAATDHYDNLASFSNFGPQSVDVAAPGVETLSTYPGAGCGGDPDCYAWMSGSSMASPVVAGAAALVLDSIVGGTGAFLPSPALRDAVTNAILLNADQSGALGQNMLAWTGWGRLNLYAALGGSGGNNTPPVADFSYSSNGLSCDFDASTSSDNDGTIVSYEWDFGDQYTDSGAAPSHAYSNVGNYRVILTVTDDKGATDSVFQDVTVSDDTGGITLAATGYKVKGRQKVDLEWGGATSGSVNIRRDGTIIGTTENDGAYTDNIDHRGGQSYIYQICESGSSNCSNEVTVTF